MSASRRARPLLSTVARLLVDGVPAAVRRHEVVNMAGEAIVLLGASDRYAQALHALDAWTQAPRTAQFALLDATLTLDSDGSWLRQALPPVAQRLRDAVQTSPATRPRPPPTQTTSRADCRLTGYAGDAAATARALRCRAVDSLTDGGETLAAARVLVAVKPPDLARTRRASEGCGKCRAASRTPPRRSRWRKCRPTRFATGVLPASGSRLCGWPTDRSAVTWKAR